MPEMDYATLLREGYAQRLPDSLDDLCGPTDGVVALPQHIVWSGLDRFDLANPRLRMSYYRIVLAEGQAADLCQYLDKATLLALWPILRTLIRPAIVDVWEHAFADLDTRTRTAA
ncbi:transcriptional regulator [Yinghuangia seranimata]|uniref:transcriptional regulator n=1 Tax=Yinghuangia seranimata TaxID=408067 RepID=UPI00248CA828|nr:transcriptional regulator [Yinghuangia seranimata]MDI2127227.1 transcriptional regulator [Yinghuangia seranimata]